MTGRIVVLGMHRSGTSCVGELLAAMGAYFGPSEMGTGGNIENPHGLFERKDLRDLCHYILQQAGAEWWMSSRLWLDRLPEEAYRRVDEMLAPILADLNANEPWFIKEPRLCLLLPMLRERLGNVVAVCVWRFPLEVSESLRTRDAMPTAFGLALWERYVRASFSAGVPAVIVNYNHLIDDPSAATVKLLADLTALGVTGLRLPTARELAKVVDPALHRSRPNRRNLVGPLDPSQRRLLQALETGNPRDPELALPVADFAALRRFEAARRRQMRNAAWLALAEARAKDGSVVQLSRFVAASRYLPWNPIQWIKWYRRGKLGRRLREHLEACAIEARGGFARSWYASRYRDVAASGDDPLMHFVRCGAWEGRDPSPRFPAKHHLHAVLEAAEGIKR